MAVTVAGAAVTAMVLTTLALKPDSSPASARVTSTIPANDAALAAAPTEVELTLSGGPDPALSHVTVRDGAGSVINVGELSRVGGDRLRQPVTVSTTGDFTASYHVTFTDGREVTGAVRFSVRTGLAPTIQAEPADVAHAHGVDPVGAVLLLLNGAVLVGVLIMLRLRPRPVRPAPDPGQPRT